MSCRRGRCGYGGRRGGWYGRGYGGYYPPYWGYGLGFYSPYYSPILW